MTSKWLTSLISGVALIGVTLTTALPAPAEQAPDKNGPGVARVSVIQGSAVVQRGDSQTQYQNVMDVLDMLGRLNITQVGLATKPLVK